MPPRTRTKLPSRTDLVLATDQPELSYLELADIRTDGGTQMRAALNPDTVADYVAVMAEHDGWGPFPPITAYYDGTAYWLADGFHRVSALRTIIASPDYAAIEDRRVPAKVIAGDRRSAILHAVAANANHGLRRTNADKRRSVETLLRDAEWRAWSDTEIARRCAVDPKTVGTIRKELARTLEILESTERKTADGRVMNTANIGVYTNEYALQEPLHTWLKAQTTAHADQHALVAALRTQQKDHPQWTALIAALPAAAKPRQITAALGIALERIQAKIGAQTYTVHQLPSGNWYGRNHASFWSVTALHATEAAAYAAACAEQWADGRRYDIERIDGVLTDFEVGGWKHLTRYDTTIQSAEGWLLNELHQGLTKAAADQPDHAELQRRLSLVQARIADLEATVNLVRPPARTVYTGSPPPAAAEQARPPSSSGLPLPGMDRAAYVQSRRENLTHLMELYGEVLDSLSDYERLTGLFGHSSVARRALTPMIETIERNLGLQPIDKS